jgi:SagB-type dehydrogenase family enzyme
MSRIPNGDPVTTGHLRTTISYHHRTKHHFHRYAASPGFMDWATQPFPFRRFEGVELLELGIPDVSTGPSWDSLFGPALPPEEISRESLSRFLYLSLALSAWKQVVSPEGEVVSRWSLRVNPSSGNLHPTEAYLLFSGLSDLAPEGGVFHYAPDGHGLEQRGTGSLDLPDNGFLIGLSSIHWREAWKYGERAFRYCQHDVGHALAALKLAARILGWSVEMVGGVDHSLMSRLLGTHLQEGPEREHADTLLFVSTDGRAAPDIETLEAMAEGLAFQGTPRPLSPSHVPWPAIDEVAEASQTGSLTASLGYDEPAPTIQRERNLLASSLIRNRRSAVSMDGRTSMKAPDFAHLLKRLLPGHCAHLFSLLPQEAETSLVFFVHRVEGLKPGLYALVRNPTHLEAWQAAFNDGLDWENPGSDFADLPFYRLIAADITEAAQRLSCNQGIAGDGVFSLGMISRMTPALQQHGPGYYPRLFWETGMIGQMLYLEAEAAGLRGTGIGCFFDDEVHRVLGLEGDSWQSLYHFTVGGPLEDSRLQTVDPYES